jgi:hypothetical protein
MGLNDVKKKENGKVQKRQKYQSVFILFVFLETSCSCVVFSIRKARCKIRQLLFILAGSPVSLLGINVPYY